MKNNELCVQIGSFYTTIYKKNVGIVLREPTLAVIQTSGKNMKVVKMGLDAQKMLGKTADGEVFVRPVVEGIIKNPDLAQKLITYFLSKVVEYNIIKPKINLIVLLPMGLSEEEYREYKRIFYAIGFNKIHFVYSILSATLCDQPYFSLGKASLVVDIGAGKTEIATISRGKILSGCTLSIGGNAIDRAIVEHLQQTKGFISSQHSAEKLKEEIGSLYKTDSSSMEMFFQDRFASTQMSAVVFSKDIMEPIYDGYFKILQTIQALLNGASQETASDIRQDGIVFIGGGARITGLEKFCKEILGLSVFVVENPEIQSVLGAEKLFADYNLLEQMAE